MPRDKEARLKQDSKPVEKKRYLWRTLNEEITKLIRKRAGTMYTRDKHTSAVCVNHRLLTLDLKITRPADRNPRINFCPCIVC